MKQAKRSKSHKPAKPYWEMSANELAEATKEFDKPLPASRMRPLTKAERARFERASRGGARSIYVSRKQKVTVELEEQLIRISDEFAKRHNMTRSELIALSLRSSLALSR
jgi:hypothetical protein